MVLCKKDWYSKICFSFLSEKHFAPFFEAEQYEKRPIEMKSKMTQPQLLQVLWQFFYVLLQCTWGFVQSLAGLLLFLKFYNHPHLFYHGCIRTKWNRNDGISLGLFIFTPSEENPKLLRRVNNDTEKLRRNCNKVAVHEYGHTYQSLLLGPLYLIVIGIPSLSWSRMKRYKELRRKYGVPYSFFWPEQWANSLGEKILKEPSIK